MRTIRRISVYPVALRELLQRDVTDPNNINAVKKSFQESLFRIIELADNHRSRLKYRAKPLPERESHGKH